MARRSLSVPGAFRLDTTGGKLAIVSGALVVLTPILASFVSSVFLVLLAVALVLSFMSMSRVEAKGEGRTTALARAGYAMAFNGILLIFALFLVGFIGDFFLSTREGLHSDDVGTGFTTVHILLGVGLLLVDNYRHAHQS